MNPLTFTHSGVTIYLQSPEILKLTNHVLINHKLPTIEEWGKKRKDIQALANLQFATDCLVFMEIHQNNYWKQDFIIIAHRITDMLCTTPKLIDDLVEAHLLYLEGIGERHQRIMQDAEVSANLVIWLEELRGNTL